MGWIRGELLGIWQGKNVLFCRRVGRQESMERGGGWGTLNE